MIRSNVLTRLVLASLALVACLVSNSRATAADVESLAREIQPKMVKIFGAGGLKNLHHYSTGFLVSSEGHIATVWSHVLDADGVTVVLADGRRFTATVLGAEPQLDLAVIKIEEEGLELPYFDLKAAEQALPGTRVLAFSNMFKVAAGDEPMSIIHGVIAAKTKLSARRGAFEVPYDGPVYVIDAITNNPGSGGGLVTAWDGRLLAMIGKELRNTESNTWINYAIPLPELSEVIDQIISGNYVSKEKPSADDGPPRYQSLDFGIVMVPDVVYRTPAYIDRIVPGSPAEAGGVLPGDLVLFVNDQLVQSCKTLASELGRLDAGDTLTLIVRRDNQLVTIQFDVPRK